MKKTIALLLALVLVLTATSALAAAPSKSGDDFNTDKNPFAFYISDEGALGVWAGEELAKLEAAGIPAYFNQAEELKAALGEGEYKVFEFHGVVAENYDESMGDVDASFSFATPYEKGSPLAVLIGIKTQNAAGEEVVAWETFKAVGQDDGSVAFQVDAETIKRVEAYDSLLAVVSK